MKKLFSSLLLFAAFYFASAQSVTLDKNTYHNGYNISCHGLANGSIDATVLNDTRSPFTYLWSNGSTSEDLSNVPVGIYTVTVTNNEGIAYTNSAELIEPDSLGAFIYLEDNNGYEIWSYGGVGSIEAEATGGSPSYTYLWSNGT